MELYRDITTHETDPKRIAEFEREDKPLPSLHSDSFAPVPEPSLKTGVLAMSMAVLNVLDEK